jgi:hypothetical protein
LVSTLRVEHRLRTLENRELREMCGPERGEMIREEDKTFRSFTKYYSGDEF